MIPKRPFRAAFSPELMRKDGFQGGFTLLELLVVVSIIALLTTVSVAGFSNFSRTQRLAQAVKSLENALIDAKSRALSSVDGLNWGAHLELNSGAVEIFSTTSISYDAAGALPRLIGENTPVSDLTLQQGGFVNIIFSVADGSVSFAANDGTCLGGSADSVCAGVGSACLAIGVNLQGTSNKRYLKVNERNIFESDTLTPCP